MNDARIKNSVCDECARKMGWKPKRKVVGVWLGTCDWCGETKPLTSLHHDWVRLVRTRKSGGEGMSEFETVDDILSEMRMDYSFALRGMGEKIGGYINRIKKASNRTEAALRISTGQHDERKRLHEIAKTAMREVQDRITHSGIEGQAKAWWRILEDGFNGNYRNDFEKEAR